MQISRFLHIFQNSIFHVFVTHTNKLNVCICYLFRPGYLELTDFTPLLHGYT